MPPVNVPSTPPPPPHSVKTSHHPSAVIMYNLSTLNCTVPAGNALGIRLASLQPRSFQAPF